MFAFVSTGKSHSMFCSLLPQISQFTFTSLSGHNFLSDYTSRLSNLQKIQIYLVSVSSFSSYIFACGQAINYVHNDNYKRQRHPSLNTFPADHL